MKVISDDSACHLLTIFSVARGCDALLWIYCTAPTQPVVPGQNALHIDVPEHLRQVPEQRAVFTVIRRLENDHQIPEGGHGVGDPR